MNASGTSYEWSDGRGASGISDTFAEAERELERRVGPLADIWELWGRFGPDGRTMYYFQTEKEYADSYVDSDWAHVPQIRKVERKVEEGVEENSSMSDLFGEPECRKSGEHRWYYEIGVVCPDLKPGTVARICKACLLFEIIPAEEVEERPMSARESRTNRATKRWRWYAKPFYWGEAETSQEATEELNRHASVPLRDCEPELSPTGVSMNYYCKTENGDWAFVGDVTRVTWDAEAEEGEGGGGKTSENNPAGAQPYDKVRALYDYLAEHYAPKHPFDASPYFIHNQAKKLGMGDELTALFLIAYVHTPEAVEYAANPLGYQYAIDDLLRALTPATPKRRESTNPIRQHVRVEPAGIIANLQGRQELILVDIDYEVEAIKDHFGNDPQLDDFDGFLVEIEDGDYTRVYGFRGTVPRLSKDAWKVVESWG